MTEIREQQVTQSSYERGESKPIPAGKISYEQFLDWLDEDTLAEWVNGEVIMTSPASYIHQDISNFLVTVLRSFVEINQLGRVISAPFQMKLPDSGREPDLIFVAVENLARIRRTFLDGPGDLVVEVVSDESQARDRETKFAEYAAGGVPEYWLIDPAQQEAQFYRLDEQGVYQAMPLDDQGRYYSRVMSGFWLQPEWLWRETLPEVSKVLVKIAGNAYKNYLVALEPEDEI